MPGIFLTPHSWPLTSAYHHHPTLVSLQNPVSSNWWCTLHASCVHHSCARSYGVCQGAKTIGQCLVRNRTRRSAHRQRDREGLTVTYTHARFVYIRQDKCIRYSDFTLYPGYSCLTLNKTIGRQAPTIALWYHHATTDSRACCINIDFFKNKVFWSYFKTYIVKRENILVYEWHINIYEYVICKVGPIQPC